MPESGVDKQMERDLRFSHFFPPSKLSKAEKKAARQNSTRKTTAKPHPPIPPPPPPPPPSTPLIHFPGRLPATRTSAPPTPKTPPRSPAAPSPTTSQRGSYASNPSDTPSSYMSAASHTAAAAPVAPTIAIHSTTRLRASLASQHSSSSPGSSHPLAQELVSPPAPAPAPPPPPPLPPPPSSLPTYPQPRPHARSASEGADPPRTWRRFRGADDEVWHRPGFLERARDARRRLARDVRQERLKRSIRVLGPTDPGVVEGYVWGGGGGGCAGDEVQEGGRRPGFMVRGGGT
ncbi:hypothetical protein K505DRAFT_328366 [Melanomma pulvis-pyrius CBS 109.77]|uniref:Uncharacterized protein n=1 Tax=Melanomma pulvis-pyrius CBS 109.77 TaxID=1314802 RepID=A0A6A6WZD9_9PLEO|nr:hypothetical protein K505DRAFT_328366 [Melanomma pulvis-pyrius CBS 109.77]